jgi:hypothetical protein
MSTEAASFFVQWLETHVSNPGSIQRQDIAQLAARCIEDAAGLKITREDIEVVAGDIEDAIRDEFEYLAVLKSMSPSP